MITITWHLLVLIILSILTFVKVMTCSKESGPFGSPRDFAMACWLVGNVIVYLIYGGVVWW